MTDCRRNKGAGRAGIVFVIFQRLADRFRDADGASEVENGLDLVVFENLAEQVAIGDVAEIETRRWRDRPT
ncbi:hypothetical protein D3C87_1658530 [compost metagenome]